VEALAFLRAIGVDRAAAGGLQCPHHNPGGLPSVAISMTLQHSEQSPQLRPGAGSADVRDEGTGVVPVG
jgi:hypothetical protein